MSTIDDAMNYRAAVVAAHLGILEAVLDSPNVSDALRAEVNERADELRIERAELRVVWPKSEVEPPEPPARMQ